eukprot:UN04850
MDNKVRKVLGDTWQFWYGPDLVRGSNGVFYVCEDNIGYVGGLGDLACSKESLLRVFSRNKRLHCRPRYGCNL